jgi:hypothetical protein
MPEYVLSFGGPRGSADGTGIQYETTRVRRCCADADTAIRWARTIDASVAPPAINASADVPLVSWLIEARGYSVIWEHRRFTST